MNNIFVDMLEPHHVWLIVWTIGIVGTIAFAVAIMLFTLVNKRILMAFIAEDRMLQDKAIESRHVILDAFLSEQRNRDDDLAREQAELGATVKLEVGSISTAMSLYNGRLRVVEEDRFPRIEARVLDLEGRIAVLEHPSLLKTKPPAP